MKSTTFVSLRTAGKKAVLCCFQPSNEERGWVSKHVAWELLFCEQSKFHLCKEKRGAYAELSNAL